MQTGIEQVPPTPWPSGDGDCVATVGVTPEWLADRYHLEFFEGTDNLDDYRAAAVRLPSARMVGLLRHAGAPDEGTEVHADINDDPAAVIGELLQALDLSPDTCTWMRAEPAVPLPQRIGGR